MSTDERDKQWASLYSALSKSLGLLGTESAFGEADYWIVDDDYGDTTHKVCVHKISFLRPQVIAAIQVALDQLPDWRVLVQMEAVSDEMPLPPEGLVIYSDHVEQRWDQARFAGLAKALHL